jgi:CheY-like chemotaxis protein/glycine cleavage system H lipoate-binding protein
MSFHFDILVIDDEPVVLAGTRKALEPEGFSIEEASSAAVALEKLKRFTYRLVLCDLKLPGGGGWELLEAAQRHLPETPFVMITGYATLESAVQSFKSGAFDFLPKPFDIAELLGVVHRALAAPRSRGDDVAGKYSLGRNSWADLEPDGVARIGIGDGFSGVEHEAREIDLPAEQEEILQGRRCARITTAGELVHTVWTPLSGRVGEANTTLGADRLATEPPDRKWLIRIEPADLDGELPNLMRG